MKRMILLGICVLCWTGFASGAIWYVATDSSALRAPCLQGGFCEPEPSF